MRCNLCPSLTPTKENWCEECVGQMNYDKWVKKYEGIKREMDKLMAPSYFEWEEHAMQ